MKGFYLIMLNFLSLTLNSCAGAGLASAHCPKVAAGSKAAGACTPGTCPDATPGWSEQSHAGIKPKLSTEVPKDPPHANQLPRGLCVGEAPPNWLGSHLMLVLLWLWHLAELVHTLLPSVFKIPLGACAWGICCPCRSCRGDGEAQLVVDHCLPLR